MKLWNDLRAAVNNSDPCDAASDELTNSENELAALRDALALTLAFIDDCGTWVTRQETATEVRQARKSLQFLIRNFVPAGYEPEMPESEAR